MTVLGTCAMLSVINTGSMINSVSENHELHLNTLGS